MRPREYDSFNLYRWCNFILLKGVMCYEIYWKQQRDEGLQGLTNAAVSIVSPITERGKHLKRIAVPEMELVKHIANRFFDSTVEVERVLKGSSTYVFTVKTADKTYYMRILPESGTSFEAEARAHQLLLDRGVNVPRIIHCERKNDAIGLSLMLAEEIRGYDLEHDHVKMTDSIRPVLINAGKQIALTNQIQVAGFGEMNRQITGKLIGEHDSFEQYYCEHLESDLYLLSGYAFNEEQHTTAKRLLELGSKLIQQENSYLVHGDFDLSHIFHEHGVYSGIIDWGDLKASSRFYDLGHFKTHDFINGFDALISGYAAVQKLQPVDKVEITIWALFIAVRRLGMIHDRPRNFYHAHLTESVKKFTAELTRLM